VAERSLNSILTEINAAIKKVSFGSEMTTYNLCYQQTKDEKTFPILNLGGGSSSRNTSDGEIIHWDEKEPMRVYHRMIGPVERETDNTKGLGNNPAKIRIYFMRAVFLGTRRALTSAAHEDNDTFAREAADIFPSILSAKEIINIENTEVDKNTVYEEEFAGGDLQKLSLDGIAFWIDYTIKARICQDVVIPTMTIRNSDGTFSQVIPFGDFTTPDINITRDDNTVVTNPANKDIDVDDFNVATTLTLTTEGADAITNIEKNGGSLTNPEKFYVDRWVARMQTNGDFGLLDYLVYSGFADTLCNVVDWIKGVIATNSGVTLDGQHFVIEAADNLDTNFNPSTDLDDASQNDIVFGAYLYTNDQTTGVVDILGGGNLQLAYDWTGNKYQTKIFNATLSNVGNVKYPLSRSLVSIKRSSSTAVTLNINGVNDGTASLTSEAPSNNDLGIGNTDFVGNADMVFIAKNTSWDDLDFYTGFEDFRTLLHSEILYNIPQQSGVTTAYRDGDEAWIDANYLDHYRDAVTFWNGSKVELTTDSFFTLKSNNFFGNTNRFTDDLGGQTYTADLVINHFSGEMIYRIQSTNESWNDLIDNAKGSLFGGTQTQGDFVNWFLPTRSGLNSLAEQETATASRVLNYSPFNILANLNFASSTTENTDTTDYYNLSQLDGRILTTDKAATTGDRLIFRLHYP